ncbi:MAG: ABC transporter ATP-binding protein [Pseudomonadota bacterium]|jgi:putative ABC transport system ATP-binding protein|nr:lipoprotein-releasing system ATP-binding protein LolD [Gammaproteobacteria bacterium]MEC8466673.1 ABC transporter ATP-binding protein [Pseudomonadota bacterium]URQ70314.1 ABC transporter ATP-binding protein [SAR86 cluster bacterium]URQ71674.1 ABC transporter ATP-binding protein [SAR86 cluster bacterium]GIS26772.1 MAG: macrolide ABC transporter ATP-binding protein [Gammaproteobacteria bacterium]|tara:strand:+ start:1402 stop:2076 length:675 start_codon:yes stop_codon:yes gene_type:complete
MINVDNLKKTYYMGNQSLDALSGVTFEITKGEYVAIMGPSGSGKSTLMNIIGCLDSPTKGTYSLNNKEVSQMSDDELSKIRNTEIGFVFQNFSLLPRSSALENVMLPLQYAGISLSERKTIALDALEKVELLDRKDHKPSELSGGQQQRVAIARALVNNPSILFADEPTGNLDSQTGMKVLDIFKRLNENGQTIILITHENEVASAAKRIIHIKDGNISNDEIH